MTMDRLCVIHVKTETNKTLNNLVQLVLRTHETELPAWQKRMHMSCHQNKGIESFHAHMFGLKQICWIEYMHVCQVLSPHLQASHRQDVIGESHLLSHRLVSHQRHQKLCQTFPNWWEVNQWPPTKLSRESMRHEKPCTIVQAPKTL